jgi:hypothetical protein
MGALTWDQAHNELWLVEQAFEKILGLRPLCKSLGPTRPSHN